MSYILKDKELNYSYSLKHILSKEWISVKYISNDEDSIELLAEYTEESSFEKDDKIIYSINDNEIKYTYNTVVLDIDFPTNDKIVIRIKKPFERRRISRYNVNLLANIEGDTLEDEAFIVDMSKIGFKVSSNSEYESKDTINISTNLNNEDVLNIDCEIVYKRDNTTYLNGKKYLYGLRFKYISKSDLVLLEDFLENLR